MRGPSVARVRRRGTGDAGRRHGLPRREREGCHPVDGGRRHLPRPLVRPSRLRLPRVSPSRPVLAPDGSLRVVTSRPSRGSCTFELLTGTPGTADLTSAATATERLRGRVGVRLPDLPADLQCRLGRDVPRGPPGARLLVRPRRRLLDHEPRRPERSGDRRRRPGVLRQRDGRVRALGRRDVRLPRRAPDPGADAPARGRDLERTHPARRGARRLPVHLDGRATRSARRASPF